MPVNNIIAETLEKKDGIWFGPSGGYWSNLNLDENKKYLEEMPLLGARETVQRNFPQYFDVIFSPKRAGGLPLLDPRPGEVVVDVGCMWGALTIPLAMAGCNVVAIDQTLESLLLLKQRLVDDKLTNVEIVCSDLKKIKFHGSSIDKFIVNGVLEWIPETGTIELKKYYGKRCVKKDPVAQNPYSDQVNFLKSIYDGLKTEGKLYLSIENRYDIFNFLGLPDPHCNVRFITFLPRPLQDIVSKIVLGRPYVNWIYSEKGLSRLLGAAGFKKIELLYAFPDYRFPEHILSKKGMEYFKPHKFRKAKNIFVKLACYAIEDIIFRRLKMTIFSPSFVVVAQK